MNNKTTSFKKLCLTETFTKQYKNPAIFYIFFLSLCNKYLTKGVLKDN